RLLDLLLDAGAGLLHLPALVGRAVVGDGELEFDHVSPPRRNPRSSATKSPPPSRPPFASGHRGGRCPRSLRGWPARKSAARPKSAAEWELFRANGPRTRAPFPP